MTSIKFERHIGPHGIPVYHQEIRSVESVAIHWVIFVGASEDHVAGADGIYHWFEHVPLRGTKRFPGGYAATKGPFARCGGTIGAWTGLDATNYWAFVHRDQWKLALDVTTDLWSQPLLEEEAVVAERQIIYEEIRQKKGAAEGNAIYQLPHLMWNGHPCGHHTLGSVETLSSMTPQTLQAAHRLGYDRSRAALVVSGNVSASELLAHLGELGSVMPDNGLATRRQPHTWGAVRQPRGNTLVETKFSSSVVLNLFPLRANHSPRETMIWRFIAELATQGGLNSPLYRIVREERQLAYSTGFFSWYFRDGGFWGFKTQTDKSKARKVTEAVHDVLKDTVFRSQSRFDEVKQALHYRPKMKSVDPRSFNEGAVQDLCMMGLVLNEEDASAFLDSFTLEEVMHLIKKLTPDNAYNITFEGMG